MSSLRNIKNLLIRLDPIALKALYELQTILKGENRSQSIASSHEQFRKPWTHFKYLRGIFSFLCSSYFVNIHSAGSSNGNSAQLRILPAGRQELRAGKNLVLTCRAQVCKLTNKRKGCMKKDLYYYLILHMVKSCSHSPCRRPGKWSSMSKSSKFRGENPQQRVVS